MLIGVSILTTWQHHFIDIPTGALLGFFCVWLWPQDASSPIARIEPTSDPARRRLAVRYAVGAIVACGVALALTGAGLWLLWVAVALSLVAINYALLGPVGFQKRGGRLTLAAAALLAPYLAAARANVWIRTRGHPPWAHVVDDVWIGRIPHRGELEKGGFDALVDMTCELPVDAGRLAYSNLGVLDLTLPDPATIDSAVQAIEQRRTAGRVLVCCALGYSRSATAAAAWMVATGRAANASAALARIRTVRPQVVLGDAHVAAIAAAAPNRADQSDPSVALVAAVR
jgi:protein-tyrosine phosphatase